MSNSNHDEAGQVAELSAKLRARIIELARAAGRDGLTISEAAQEIPDHKNTSVSPRFSELVARGGLVRVLTGRGKPSKRAPWGIARYMTRLDPQTKRHVIIHWLPGFAPSLLIHEMRKKPAQRLTRAVTARRFK